MQATEINLNQEKQVEAEHDFNNIIQKELRYYHLIMVGMEEKAIEDLQVFKEMVTQLIIL